MFKNMGIYGLMVILFTTSTGFTLFTHFCFMNGNQEVSPTKIDSCCAIELPKAETEFSSNCCNDETNFIKFDFQAFAQRNIILDELPPAIELVYIDFVPSIEKELPQHSTGLPPPKSGRERLIEIQLLRI